MSSRAPIGDYGDSLRIAIRVYLASIYDRFSILAPKMSATALPWFGGDMIWNALDAIAALMLFVHWGIRNAIIAGMDICTELRAQLPGNHPLLAGQDNNR